LAMDLPFWPGLIHRDHTMEWLQYLPSLRTLTVVVSTLGHVVIRGSPVHFVTMTPDSCRGASVKKFMWWMRKCLEAHSLNSSIHSTPQLDIKLVSSQKDDSSSVAEHNFRVFQILLDARIKDAEEIFGKMPEM